MIDWSKDEEKRRNAITFVETTQKLIDSEGLENISIRKIAEHAGFHNSTIYLYFEDINQLILLASQKHFIAYARKLEQLNKMDGDPKEKFLAIWQAFGEMAFHKPHIFRNYFFGKHSNELSKIINLYYDLFPEEKPSYMGSIKEMYYGNDIFYRCLQTLNPLVNAESTCIREDNIHLLNTIIVACLKHLLDQLCMDASLDADAVNAQLIQMICHVTGIK